MDTALAVLLYLNVITNPGTYYTSQISSLEQAYSTQMAAVENDPVQLNAVLIEFEPLEPTITILDDTSIR